MYTHRLMRVHMYILYLSYTQPTNTLYTLPNVLFTSLYISDIYPFYVYTLYIHYIIHYRYTVKILTVR